MCVSGLEVRGGFSSNLLFPQDALDALALVGTEGDAGFSGAGALFHLLLLVFLLHLHLEVTRKKKKEPSQHWWKLKVTNWWVILQEIPVLLGLKSACFCTLPPTKRRESQCWGWGRCVDFLRAYTGLQRFCLYYRGPEVILVCCCWCNTSTSCCWEGCIPSARPWGGRWCR